MDGPFIAWRRRSAPEAQAPASVPDASSLEVRLWSAVASGRDTPPALAEAGPLSEQGTARSIEVWTETEFCALHAVLWLALERPRGELADRALEAARWHLEHTQPDNATQRPWAVHAFALLESIDGNADARLYAETLLHACQVSMGGADMLSRHILWDAADWLDEACNAAERRSP